jgi:hypothetical protein
MRNPKIEIPNIKTQISNGASREAWPAPHPQADPPLGEVSPSADPPRSTRVEADKFQIRIINDQNHPDKNRGMPFGIWFLLIVICSGFDIGDLGFQDFCLGKEEELCFKFKAGDKYFLSSVTEEKITRVVEGNEAALQRTTRFGSDFDVEEVDENGFSWVRYTYRQTAMKSSLRVGQTEPEELDFDSNKETKKINTEAIPLFVILDEEFYVRISPQGFVDKINGLQTLISSAKNKAAFLAEPERTQAIKDITERLSETSVKSGLENLLAVFPDPCINPDKSGVVTWSRTEHAGRTEGGATQWILERDFRLKEPPPAAVPARRDAGAASSAVIDVNITVRPQDVNETILAGRKFRRKVSGSGFGQVEIEKTTGRIVSYKTTVNTIEEIEITPQGPVLRLPPPPEPIKTNIVTTFQMTRRESPIKMGEPNQPAGSPSGDVNH